MAMGQSIKEKIAASGHSVRQVAILAGVSSQAVYQWIWGKTEPNVYALICVADVLGVSLDELIGRTVKTDGCKQ